MEGLRTAWGQVLEGCGEGLGLSLSYLGSHRGGGVLSLCFDRICWAGLLRREKQDGQLEGCCHRSRERLQGWR